MPVFYVRALKDDGRDAQRMLYVAWTETAEGAVDCVRLIVGQAAEIKPTGQVMSPVTAHAIRLRPGQAKLV